MKKFTIVFVLAVFVVLLMNSCYFDNEEDLYPALPNCDTLDIKYSLDVVPIFDSFCFACHGDLNYASLGSGIRLEGYENTMILVNSGVLLNSIEHNGQASFMPKNSGKLAECNIAIIRNWINQGALNN